MKIMFRYWARQFLLALLIVTGSILLLVFLVDIAELFRRVEGKDVAAQTVFYMAALKLPTLALELLPFLTLLTAFYILTKRQEFTVLRVAGLSSLRVLSPLLLTAYLVGLLASLALQPLSVQTLRIYEDQEQAFIGKQGQSSRQPIQLRERTKNGSTLIFADYAQLPVLYNTTILQFNLNNRLLRRIEAKYARLRTISSEWMLKDVTILEDHVLKKPTYQIETSFTEEQLNEIALDPETLSFWQLPRFINQQQKAGFTATRYQVYFQNLLATPVFYMMMILLAAAFLLRPASRNSIWIFIFMGILTGFLLYFGRNITTAMGMSGKLPVLLAVWSPVLLVGMLSTARLLDREG